MRFTDYGQASAWRRDNDRLVRALNADVTRISGVSYTEDWLCGRCPSFVAGFNDDDEMIVCVPIRCNSYAAA
jgi:hypothetical protein